MARKAAIIVEPRKHRLLAAVLQNVHERLPADWDMYIFHGPANATLVTAATKGFKRRVHLKDLGVTNLAAADYNRLMLSEEFWAQVAAEHILVFQADSVLCGKGKANLDRFLKYPYIGCSFDKTHLGTRVPWPGKAFYGVGGLSLRKKSFMLDCIRSEAGVAARAKGRAEDVTFSECAAARPDRVTDLGEFGAFCAEYYLNHPAPLGVHKTHHDFKEDKATLFAACPEATLLEALKQSQTPASQVPRGGGARRSLRATRRRRRRSS